jgi:hypothetical protein
MKDENLVDPIDEGLGRTRESIGDIQEKNLPQPTPEQEKLLEAGLFVRKNDLPPWNGAVFRYRRQYVYREPLYFSVTGSLYPDKTKYRAVYMLLPVWGYYNDFHARVEGYPIDPIPQGINRTIQDFACIDTKELTVQFADDPSKL